MSPKDSRRQPQRRPPERLRDTQPLPRLLSQRGMISRTLAVEWIVAGRVAVDGRRVCRPQDLVRPQAQLTLDGQRLEAPAKVVFVMNKPRGVVTTRHDPEGRPIVYDLLPPDAPWLVPVGRLDMASAGLLLWTNDTALAADLTDPQRHVPRVYDVKVAMRLDDARLDILRKGVRLADGATTLPCEVERLRVGPASCWLRFVLHEGRNRQIRRMIEAVTGRQETVRWLIRRAFGPIELGDLPPAAIRPLRPQEEQALRALFQRQACRRPSAYNVSVRSTTPCEQ